MTVNNDDIGLEILEILMNFVIPVNLCIFFKHSAKEVDIKTPDLY